MMGIKERAFKIHPHVSLDNLVPEQHLYRQLEAKIDLSFVRELVKDFYLPYGRPSIDPVVFFKLQLIMLFEGIRSERQLLEQVQINLAFRWYIGYDLDECVPDHSSLTKIRERYGLPIFRRFFEQILQLCFDAGLVWGKELYFDGTRVEANAAMSSHVSNFEYGLANHLNILFPTGATAPAIPPSHQTDFTENWIESYKHAPQEGKRDPYISISNFKTSLTDADATPLRISHHLGYHTQYVVDGGKNRIILAALVTPASIQDNQPMLDLIRWLHFRWHIHPKIAVGDSKFGSIDNIVALFREGILPLMPRAEYAPSKQFYNQDMFRYDAQNDVYYCPQNQIMKKQGQYRENRSFLYQGKAKICKACPVREKCTTNKRGRTVHRSFFQEDLDRAAVLRKTEAYAKAMRKRQVWIEPMFGEGKQWHGLRRFRLRRLWRVNIEALLIASVQNLKRLLKPRFSYKNHPDPAVENVLYLPQPCFIALKFHWINATKSNIYLFESFRNLFFNRLNSLSEAPNSQTVNCSSVNSALRQLEDAQEDYQLYINEGYEWDPTFVADPDSEAGTQLDEAQTNYDVAIAQCENTTPLSVYEIQVSSAEAAVQQAQAALDSILNGPTTEEIASAEAQLQQSQLQLNNARASLEDAVLNAPFSGVIAAVDIVPGQLVNTSTVVITLVDVSRLHVDVSVDELDIPQVTIGQSVNVTPEALNGEAIEGTVVRISPTAEETDGVVTYPVRVDLNETEGLRVGMTTDVEIVVSTEEGVLVVPTDAIQRAGANEFVQVQNEDGTTTNVNVTTGVTVNDQTVVEGDLEEGDTVIVPEREDTGGSGFGGPFGG